MHEIISKDRRVWVYSNEILKIKIKYPVFSDSPEINAFYEKISGNALEYCETQLGEWAKHRCDIYVSNTGGIKGFEKYSYSFICSVCLESNDVVAVKTKVSLGQGGGKISGMEYLGVVWWDKPMQMIMHPKKAIERICKKQKGFRKIKQDSTVLVEGGEIFLQKGDEKVKIGEFLPIENRASNIEKEKG